jgi:hypothetical protein
MHVVLRHVTLHDLYLVLRADIPDQIPYTSCYLSAQSRPSIFRDPDQVQMDLEYGMRAATVFCHLPSLICGARAKAVA